MKDFLTKIPVVNDLTYLVEWLLVLNVMLTGVVILLAFRAAHYKHKAEELEAELNEAIGNTITEVTLDQPVSHRRGRR